MFWLNEWLLVLLKWWVMLVRLMLYGLYMLLVLRCWLVIGIVVSSCLDLCLLYSVLVLKVMLLVRLYELVVNSEVCFCGVSR